MHPPEMILKSLQQISKNTLIETLNITFTEVGEDYIIAEIPIHSGLYQPQGFMHGGVSLALAETVGSVLSAISVNTNDFNVFGSQLNAYHLKPVKEGKIYAKATFIKKGKTIHLVQINISDENKNNICFCTMENVIVPK